MLTRFQTRKYRCRGSWIASHQWVGMCGGTLLGTGVVLAALHRNIMSLGGGLLLIGLALSLIMLLGEMGIRFFKRRLPFSASLPRPECFLSPSQTEPAVE